MPAHHYLLRGITACCAVVSLWIGLATCLQAATGDDVNKLFWSEQRPVSAASAVANSYLAQLDDPEKPNKQSLSEYFQAQLLLAEIEYNARQNDALQQRLARLLPMFTSAQYDQYHALALLYKGKLVGLRDKRPEQAEPYLKKGVSLIDHYWQTVDSPNVRILQIATGLHENLGRLYAHLHENYQALPQLKMAAILQKKLENETQQAWLNAYIGAVYKNMGQLTDAAEYYFRALSTAEKLRDPKLKAYVLVRLGNVYSLNKDYASAIKLMTQAIQSYQQLKNTKQVGKTLNMLGSVYLAKEEPKQAILDFIQAKSMFEQLDDNYNLGLVNHNIALAYLAMNDLDKAQAYTDQALALFKKIDHQGFLAKTLELDAQIAIKQNHFEKAQQDLAAGLAIAESIGDDTYINENTQTLTQLLAEEGNYKAAYHHIKALAQARERLVNKAQQQAVSNLRSEYEYQRNSYQQQQHAQSIQQLQSTVEIQWRWLMLLAVVTMCLVLWLTNRFLVLRQLRQKRNQELESQYWDITTGLPNRDAYIRWLNGTIQEMHRHVDQSSAGPFTPIAICMADLGDFRLCFEYVGYKKGRQLEKRFGEYLQRHFPAPHKVFRIRHNRLLICHPHLEADVLAENVRQSIDQFWASHFSESRSAQASIGALTIPFVKRAVKTTDHSLIAEIIFLASAAANALTVQSKRSSWVVLNAIDNTPPTLFSKEKRKGLLLALRKGFIKVYANQDKTLIDWDIIDFYELDNEELSASQLPSSATP